VVLLLREPDRSARNWTYSADDLARVVDNGNRLLERHLGLYRPVCLAGKLEFNRSGRRSKSRSESLDGGAGVFQGSKISLRGNRALAAVAFKRFQPLKQS
jgi:hypothetical protein